jgi:hypothetical protein
MIFKSKNLREIAGMVVGDAAHFKYRSSYFITEFFLDCGCDFRHDGSTRSAWTAEKLQELLTEPQSATFALPDRFLSVLRSMMDVGEAEDGDANRLLALAALNIPLRREGYEAFFGEDKVLYVQHLGTKTISSASSPHRPFSQSELKRRLQLEGFLERCSEDEMIEEVLLPMFRQLGYQRITVAGHADKALEYGKDLWMRFTLPTQHVLYFGVQAKKGKLDSAGLSKSANQNIAEVHNQALMMLGHEIFDPETSKKALVDHAFIVAGGQITKQARNWLGEKLDISKRSQIMFIDREDILNLYIGNNMRLPAGAEPKEGSIFDSEVPF